MLSIRDIYHTVSFGDSDPRRFQGLSYGITNNDSLGLSGPDGSPFLTISPFDNLPVDQNAYVAAAAKYAAGKMPIQQTFKKVLKKGYELSKDQKTLFIDIADLDGANGDLSFLTEGGPDSIAEAIAHLVNNDVPQNFTPVIRFLRGTEAPSIDQSFKLSRQSRIEAVFWKTEEGKDPVPRITHPNAELHVGYYSPNLKFTPEEEAAFKNKATSAMKGSFTPEQVEATMNALFKNLTISASWNHGKIVAIGGKTMMTGGINYWPNYIGKDSPSRGRIIDMQATVTGDAAASAQGGYLDYFWKYLNLDREKDRRTDVRSFKKSIPLASEATAGHLPWVEDKKVPIFKDTVQYTPKTTGIPVLSVARVGDWSGPRLSNYPVQFFDGLRDVYINIRIPALLAASKFKDAVELINWYSDEGGPINFLLALAGWSNAAWASDTARIFAIKSATSTVYTSGQMLVGALQRDNDSYKTMVKTINGNKPREQRWDGYIWPYDVLLAFATVIIRLRDAGAPKDSKTKPGIFIVLGNKPPPPGVPGGAGEWDDARTSVGDITTKIIPLLRGLDTNLSEAQATELVGKYFEIRRIGKPYGDEGPNTIHTKTICVDEKVLYVGSDNLYPSYNEEHGIWVDEEKTVKGWVDGYWKVLWEKTSKLEATDPDLKATEFQDI